MAGKMSMADKLANRVQPLREQGSGTPEPAQGIAITPAEEAAAPDTTTTSEPSSSAPQAPREKSPRKRRAPAATARQEESAGDPGDIVAAVITIRKDIDARLMAYRKTTRKSHPVILFDAIEATHEQLPELVRIALGKEEDPAPVRKLFDRSPRTDTPIKTEDSVERVDHTVRLTRANRELLSQIADEVGAPSRTFMMEIAYDAYLPKD